MNTFGIEIRKKGNIENLYNDVDFVLGKYGMNNNQVSDIAKRQTVAHSLQNMLKSNSHFSVCTIESCADLCQVCISSERKSIYKAAHCISWSSMLPEYRQMLVAMILDDFRYVLSF